MVDQAVSARSSAPAGADEYLTFVDGLRAISILAVVAYHVGLPAPTGGFFGVDIFFVISGFLIIGQIVGALEAGRFSFAQFWSRRALRILPPYLLVIVSTGAIASFVLVSPAEFSEFGNEVSYSAAMLANVWFGTDFGYFHPDSFVKPLLHLWSLAVEEQFYVVAPIVLALVYWVASRWRSPRARAWTMALALVVAFGVSLYAMSVRIEAASQSFFFATHLRAWEFVAGGAASLGAGWIARHVPAFLRELGALAGMGLIGVGLVLFGDPAAFPSWQTLMPVLGATLALAAGSAKPTLVSRALAWAPLRGIGLVSYAWYLWHWPLLSLSRINNFGRDDLTINLVAAGVSFLLAVLTHLLVERPLRARRQSIARPRNWRPVIAGVLACLVVAAGGYGVNRLLVPRLERQYAEAIRPVQDEVDPGCRLQVVFDLHRCRELTSGAEPVLLFGDSHADAAAQVFKTALKARGMVLAGMALSACPPDLETIVLPSRLNALCLAKGRHALDMIRSNGLRIKRAIIEAQWTFHADHIGPVGATRPGDPHREFTEAIERTLVQLEAVGITKFLVIASIPYMAANPSDCIMRADRRGVDRDAACSLTRSYVEMQREPANSWLRQVLAHHPEAELADPLPGLCDDTMCRPYRGDTVIYTDRSHLSRAGVELLYRQIEPQFDWLLSDP